MSTGREGGGGAKHLKKAEEDVRGEEQQDDRGARGRPEGHHRCPQQVGEAPPQAGGAGDR